MDPENPVQLVDLVLQADGEQPVRFFYSRETVNILVPQTHAGRPFDRLDGAGHGDAAFLMSLQLSGPPDDLRIDVYACLARYQFKNGNTPRFADMRTRDANAGCCAHGVEEVAGQGFQRAIKDGDDRRRLQ